VDVDLGEDELVGGFRGGVGKGEAQGRVVVVRYIGWFRVKRG
jgi:hypothetical protein